MKKMICILGFTLFGAGCTIIGPTTGACVDPPVTPVNINFVKNSVIRVLPPSVPTKRGNILRFKLTGESGTDVTVSGKDTDPDAVWIAGKGQAGGSRKPVAFFDVCVDPSLDISDAPGGKTYSYNIFVSGVGMLDPRVIVTE